MILTRTPEITPEAEVTIAWLQSLFRRAYMTCEVDADGDLYISDGLEFPIRVSMLEEQKLIRFFTYLRHDVAEHGAITEISADHLNSTVLLPTFHVCKGQVDTIHSACVLPYGTCVVDAHVVGAARRFSGASLYGAQRLHEFVLH